MGRYDGKKLEWNKQQNLDDENKKTIYNVKFKKTTDTLCDNGRLFLDCCKRKSGYR